MGDACDRRQQGQGDREGSKRGREGERRRERKRGRRGKREGGRRERSATGGSEVEGGFTQGRGHIDVGTVLQQASKTQVSKTQVRHLLAAR